MFEGAESSYSRGLREFHLFVEIGGCPLLLMEDYPGHSIAMAPVQSRPQDSRLKGMAKYLHCSNSFASRAALAIETSNALSRTPSLPHDSCSAGCLKVDSADIGSSSTVILAPDSIPVVKVKMEDLGKGSRDASGSGSGDQSFDDDLIVLEPEEEARSLEAVKKRSYELNRSFKDSWAAKLPWAEPIIGANSQMTQVKCIYCSFADGWDRLLAPKLDSLWKHVGRRRAEKDMYEGKELNVKFGDVFFLKDTAHIRNEIHYVKSKGQKDIGQLVVSTTSNDVRKKVTQFAVLFHFMSRGKTNDKI